MCIVWGEKGRGKVGMCVHCVRWRGRGDRWMCALCEREGEGGEVGVCALCEKESSMWVVAWEGEGLATAGEGVGERV